MKKVLVLGCAVSLLSTFSSMTYSFKSQGFYLGGDLGITNLTTNYNNKYHLAGTDSAFPTLPVSYTNKYNTSVSAPLFTPGILLDYQKLYSNVYALGAELAVRYNTGHTTNTDQSQDAFSYSPIGLQENDFSTQANLRYSVDLAVKPGLLLTDSILSYMKLGATLTGLNTTLSTTHNNAFISETYTSTGGNSNHNIWGLLVGAGLEKSISNTWSIFAEYNFNLYERVNLKTVSITDRGTTGLSSIIATTSNYQRAIQPYSNRFDIGVRYAV